MGKSTSEKSIGYMSLTGFGNLIKLLPTGTVFLFQFLNPVLTNNGKCHVSNKYLSGALIGFCGLSCFFSSFTDSYTGTDGITHYGNIFGTYFNISNSASRNRIMRFANVLQFPDFKYFWYAFKNLFENK